MTEKEFMWKGLRFVWDGRARRWSCDRPRHQGSAWWVTHHLYERSLYLPKGSDTINWDEPPPEDHPDLRMFANMGYMAHFGHGDAALRPTREEALQEALGYALHFHHQSIAALRAVLFAREIQP